MKVKKETIEAAILKLITQITNTMPNPTYQFVMGGATAFATMKSSEKIGQFLGYVSDENGLVDVDALQRILDGAFGASGGRFQIQLFDNVGLLSMFVKPLTVTILKSDIDGIMDEIRANSVGNEVTLRGTGDVGTVPRNVPSSANTGV